MPDFGPKTVFSMPFKRPIYFHCPAVTGERIKSCHTACIPPHADLINVVNNPTESFEKKLQEAVSNPKNMGETPDADTIGTVGSADCGDMLRMFLKFTGKDGQKIIDRASFQSFGCQAASASMATEMLKGKTVIPNPLKSTAIL